MFCYYSFSSLPSSSSSAAARRNVLAISAVTLLGLNLLLSSIAWWWPTATFFVPQNSIHQNWQQAISKRALHGALMDGIEALEYMYASQLGKAKVGKQKQTKSNFVRMIKNRWLNWWKCPSRKSHQLPIDIVPAQTSACHQLCRVANGHGMAATSTCIQHIWTQEAAADCSLLLVITPFALLLLHLAFIHCANGRFAISDLMMMTKDNSSSRSAIIGAGTLCGRTFDGFGNGHGIRAMNSTTHF